MSGTRLAADVHVRERDVHLTFSPRPGRITAVIGPNGAGKSTLLGAVSGAVASAGTVELDGRDIIRLPRHRRGVSHLQQDPVLFDHLTVRENVAFGPRALGHGRARARRRAEELLAQVEATELVDRRPRQISGGQAQRVAIARALATDPALILLDEPFAALDAEVSGHLRSVFADVIAGRTALLVTHDLLDVLALADDVAVLDGGRLVQSGTREAVVTRPRTSFAARLLGKVLLRGTAAGGAVRTQQGDDIAGTPDAGVRDGAAVVALIDPAHVRVEPVRRPHVASGARPTQPGLGEVEETGVVDRVAALDRVGMRVLVRAGDLAAEVAPERLMSTGIAVGSTVRLVVDPARTPIYAEVDEDHDASLRPPPASR